MAVGPGVVQREGEMVMRSLAIFLWWIFVIFTLVAIACCIEAYIRYHRKRGIDTGDDLEQRYRYFVQSICDQNSRVVGYALLLREYDSQTHQWHLPEHVTDFPLSRVIMVIHELVPHLEPSIKFITLNVTVSQVLDFRMDHFINWAQNVLGKRQLRFELGSKEILQSSYFKQHRLNHQLKVIADLGVSVIIEDIDSSLRTYQVLRKFLPNVQYLKFKASAFNKSHDHWIDVTLGGWQKQAAQYHLQMILEQVEESQQDQLADQLKIPYRQGYFYDHPRDISHSNGN